MTWRRALLTLSAAIAAVIVVAALFLAWTATTPAGLRLAARVAASLAPGLEIEAPSGTLLGRLELGRIRWTGPLREIEAKEVVRQWRPSRLLDRLLRVEQLEIGELRVASRPDGTPAQAPIDLQLPVALQVERVRIGRLGLDTLTDKGPEPGLELSDGGCASFWRAVLSGCGWFSLNCANSFSTACNRSSSSRPAVVENC